MKIGGIAQDIRNGRRGEVTSVTRYHVIVRCDGKRRYIPHEFASKPGRYRKRQPLTLEA